MVRGPSVRVDVDLRVREVGARLAQQTASKTPSCGFPLLCDGLAHL
jgi:hypothetical protein